MAIKRTRTYAVAHGVQVAPDGTTGFRDVTVDSRCRKDDVIMRRAKRENKNFVPTGVTYFEQECVMSDDVFYEHCEVGEPREVSVVAGDDAENGE